IMLADPLLRYADIQACCACLGFREGSVYKIDADAEASVRTLLRYLRNESHECDVRRELGRLRIVSSDLIPLLRSCTGNRLLVELVIRLLMNLTQPAIVCFRQEIPKDRDLYGAYVQVDDLLKSYKKKWEERSEDDRLLIERVLILTRNVLHIAPDPAEERRTDEDVSVHDQLLWALHLSGWDELLLFLGNAEDEQMFAFHTLEIISLMLREQTPELLASAGKQTPEIMQMSEQNRFGGTYELYNTLSLSNRPLIYHHNVTSSINPTQPSRTSTTDSSLVAHQFEDKVGIVDLDIGKRVFRKPKSRKPLIERAVHRRSILAVQLFLQASCTMLKTLSVHIVPDFHLCFSTNLYRFPHFNAPLSHAWDCAETLSASTFHWIYDQVMHYREVMLSDKRGGGTNRKAIQASRRLELSVAAYREFLTCLGRMIKTTEADHIPDLSASETQDIVEERLRIQSTAAESIMGASVISPNLVRSFPRGGVRGILLHRSNLSVPGIYVKAAELQFLQDLVEGSHLFISLLTDRIKDGNQKLFVRRRKFVRRKRRRSAAAKSVQPQQTDRTVHSDVEVEPPELRTLRLDYQWSHQLAPTLIGALSSTDTSDRLSNDATDADDDPEESRLFDATSGSSEAQQLRSAIRRVQAALFAGEAIKALCLARRLWRLWPEVAPVTLEEDDPVRNDDRAAGLIPSNLAILGALRQIHATEFQEDGTEPDDERDADTEEQPDEDLMNEELGLDGSGDEDGLLVTTEKEVQMDLTTFLLKFAHPRIVHTLTLLLADYATNPRSTNAAIVHFIHRLAVRQRLPGCFFQLRLFYTFQQFHRNRALSTSAEYKDLANISKYILRKFFEAYQLNNAVSIELLFFKSVKEGYEASKGYGTFEDSKKSMKWNPDLDEELTKLFEAYRNDPVPRGMRYSLKVVSMRVRLPFTLIRFFTLATIKWIGIRDDRSSEDLADVLLKHFSDVTKTRRQIVARLIFLGLISSLKQLKQITSKVTFCFRSVYAASRIRPERTHSSRSSRIPTNEADREEWTEEEVMRLPLLSEIMTDLAMDHELALRQQEEFDANEDGARPSVPLLRSRRAVRTKLLELNFVSDPAALGRQSRRRTVRSQKVAGRGRLNIDLDMPMRSSQLQTRRKRRKRNDSSSNEDLCFHSDEQDAGFDSDDDVSIPDPTSSNESNNSDASVNEQNPVGAIGKTPPIALKPVIRNSRIRASEIESDSDADKSLVIDNSPMANVTQEPDNLLASDKSGQLLTMKRIRVLSLESSDDDVQQSDEENLPLHNTENNTSVGALGPDGVEVVIHSSRPRPTISSDSDG
ncbi:timeless, partial [Paragonimus westermani]